MERPIPRGQRAPLLIEFVVRPSLGPTRAERGLLASAMIRGQFLEQQGAREGPLVRRGPPPVDALAGHLRRPQGDDASAWIEDVPNFGREQFERLRCEGRPVGSGLDVIEQCRVEPHPDHRAVDPEARE